MDDVSILFVFKIQAETETQIDVKTHSQVFKGMSTSCSTYFVSVSSTNINKAQRGKSYMAVRFQINDHKKLQLL